MIIIREVGQEWSGVLVDIIRQSFKDVALRFSLNQENCPTHPSNCTVEWIREDFRKGKRLVDYFEAIARKESYKGIEIGVIRNHEALVNWYKKIGFKESECKKLDHLPFEVLFMDKEIGKK